MKDLFLGTVFTKVNKKHLCHTCGGDIMPDETKKIYTRHDVWKTGKTVVNKYYCKDCEKLIDFMSSEAEYLEIVQPYNPKYLEFKKFKYKVLKFFLKLFNKY